MALSAEQARHTENVFRIALNLQKMYDLLHFQERMVN